MLPIKDDNPTTITPWVTYAIIALNVAVFLVTISLSPKGATLATLQYGAIPAVLFGHANLPAQLAAFPPGYEFLSIFTSMFMHGGWMHIAGNMLYLWVFGNNVEDAMGHFRFLIFYLLCGVAAAVGHGLLDPQSQIPMIGASGALAGVLGAYFLLYPKARILVWFFWVFIFYVPAVFVLGFWFVTQVFNFGSGAGGGIAWVAHIAGFIAGLVLIPLFKHRNVPLWHDGSHAPAFGVYRPGRPGRKARGASTSGSGIPPWAAAYEAERAAKRAAMKRDRRGPWGKETQTGEDRDTSPWGRYQPTAPKPKPAPKPGIGVPKVVRLHSDRDKDDT